MGRMYTAVFGGDTPIAVSAIQDLFEVVAPADAIVVIHAIHLHQTSDLADAQEEVLDLEFTFGYTTSGSSGASTTARPHEKGDAAFGGTVEVNNTTQALNGSGVIRRVDGWNIRVGYDYIPTPETRFVISPSARFVLELPNAPNDALSMSGSITFEEIGG